MSDSVNGKAVVADGMKSYLGDSVYAEEDGFGIILTTENGLPDDPSNKIYLDPEVMDALVQFRTEYCR